MDFDEFLNELPADYLKNRDNIKVTTNAFIYLVFIN